ncbi:C2H2 finger domain transcription factor crzA [Yarrowia sp. C11]|nr:C2H2 finger domain transcription factor crzA [Yarrowia sp. E02]KAG5369068.1 C2H2 finger domain transcription factor crzA [Yarrowia sp. C11]
MSNTGYPLQEVFEPFDPKDYYLFENNPTKQDPNSIQQNQQPPSSGLPLDVNTSGFDDSAAIINANTPSPLQAGSVSPQPQQMDFLSPQDFRFASFDDPQSFLNPYDVQTQPSTDFLLPVSQQGHHRANSHSSDTSAAPSPQQFHSPYAASPVNPDDYAAEMAGLPELTYGLDLNSSQDMNQMNMAVSPMAMGMPDQMNQMNQMNQQGNLNPPFQMNHNTSHTSLSDLNNANQGNLSNHSNQNSIATPSSNTPGVALSPSLLTPNMLSPNSSQQSYSSSPQTSQGSISSQSHQSIPMLNVEPPRDDPSRRRAHSDASHYSDRSSTPYEVPTLFPHATSSPSSQVQDPADLLSPGDAASIQTRRSRSRSSSISSDVRARDQSHSPSRSPSQGGGNRSRSNSHSRDYILELAAPTSNNKRVQKHPSTFACHLCDKRFTRSYNLRSHLRTHTDERPFVCTVCGKAFARQHDRKRHEALHSGEKKYQCQGVLADGQTPWGCGRKFARADALGRHFKTEAGRECIRLLLEEEANEKQALSGQQVSYPGDGVPSLTFSPPAEPQNEPRPQQPVIFPAALLQKYPVLLNHLNED